MSNPGRLLDKLSQYRGLLESLYNELEWMLEDAVNNDEELKEVLKECKQVLEEDL